MSEVWISEPSLFGEDEFQKWFARKFGGNKSDLTCNRD